LHFLIFKILYPKFGSRSGGKRPFGRPRHRWEDSIKKNLEDLEWKSMG
jgi:hypothetical protein